MKRSILLALVAALVLALGCSATASAAAGGAEAQTAAKKKGKKKAAKCKTAKKKAKGKARKSLADSAAKKKKKAAKCKAKAKPKQKGKAQPKAPAAPNPPAPNPPTPPAGFTDGVYRDAAAGVTVTIGGGVTNAQISFPSGECGGRFLLNLEGPLAQQGADVGTSQTTSVFGGAGSVQWMLAITPATLAYRFDSAWVVQFPEQNPCQETVLFNGTLQKQ